MVMNRRTNEQTDTHTFIKQSLYELYQTPTSSKRQKSNQIKVHRSFIGDRIL